MKNERKEVERSLFEDGLMPVFPIEYHFIFICDKNRTQNFRKAIQTKVDYGDVVGDFGAGSGILSLFASEKAKKIYAIEIDQSMLSIGARITSIYTDKIQFLLGDSREIKLPEKIDVAICEMLDTALISEFQVPVMNYVVKNLLKEGGRVIPYRVVTKVELVNVNFEFFGFKFNMPYYEAFGEPKPNTPLSNSYVLHDIKFDRVNQCRRQKTITTDVKKSGTFNAVRFLTYTYLDKNILVHPSKAPYWFNPPYIYPMQETYVKKGDQINLHFDYELGGGWGKFRLKVI
jgi:predicted RNA methylase